MGALIAVLLGSLLLSAGGSLLEACLLALSREEIARLWRTRPRAGRTLRFFKEEAHRTVLAIRIFRILVQSAGAVLAGVLVQRLFGPGWLLPFMVLIEAVSFLSRPVSLSLRLFGNMLAGHIALKVFGGFVVALIAAGGAATIIAPLPLLLAVALTALEFLVAFLQAYVFAILTCVYLNDALHPGH